ncbi:sensor histidine kinase [Paracoccus saliphilus]|uniref:histidine kinase n=1 Tax=Paracoccus saliphilus TaxID=405559 RepID=A0AA45W8R6_9RHOB|nr:cache domain-containing protein [Paracoccus saliphilus]WCR02696.1 cache domain-containing protein [Paracoccus saliphilus]WCR03079.1 cache domain-containing protein [Paracoccus saliphilus]SIT18674.1 HAMP domain-containing protein [Paracoccus saliphilus]
MSGPGRLLRSVRVRLLVIALLPMLVLFPVMLGGAMLRWSNKMDNLLIVKVNSDLTIADQYLQHLLENSVERLDALAGSVAFEEALQRDGAKAYIAARKEELGLDFLYLSDGSPLPRGFVPRDWPVIEDALAGAPRSAIDILSAGQLDALSPGLPERAAIRLVPTRAARPTDRLTEDRGMIIHSAAPVTMPDGTRRALVGGVLLNRNLDFIDTINALVYRERSLPEGSQGTATLFLDDVRISTNVRLFENVRALGTRVSAEVRQRVLDDGATWLDRAFVVNDWYISAYQPITDSKGENVGMLYVGFLEAPFQRQKINTIVALSLIFVFVAAISVPIFLRWAGRIFRPLERMTQTIAEVEAGNLDARNGPHEESGEIAQVAQHLDGLLNAVQERDRQLRDWGESLEQKVEERTRDLQEANSKLERATERLIMSEKLAAVGEITAGVAHEINNPIAVIQGNLDVARDLLGEDAKKVETEFRLIDDQVYRVGVIVSKLLQFARPAEYSGAANLIVPAEVARDCLVLTRQQIEKARIESRTNFATTRAVLMERTELQQVVVNLILNAVHAMPGGGILTMSVLDEDDHVVIRIEDTGSGIPSETLKRIFDPFFTTKQAQGTGLGLSISQQLVGRIGGRIVAASEPGQGSRFDIILPAAENS